jgi:hypothetical protein
MRYNNNEKFKEKLIGSLVMCFLFALLAGAAYLLDYFELINFTFIEK